MFNRKVLLASLLAAFTTLSALSVVNLAII